MFFAAWQAVALAASAGGTAGDGRGAGDHAALLLTATASPTGERGGGRSGRDPMAGTLTAADRAADETTLIFGPEAGEFVYNNGVALVDAELSVRDFVAEATVSVPFAPGRGTWIFAIQFRTSAVNTLWVVVNSDGDWSFVDTAAFDPLASGTVRNLNLEAGDRNTMRLVVQGEAATFSLNGELIEQLDVSSQMGLGSVQLISAVETLPSAGEFKGLYSGFAVYGVGLNPTATPTLAASQPGMATVGKQRGEIPVGGGQTWTYNGRAGELIDILVEADDPANATSVEERIAQNLLDTYVIVRAPDGTVIAEADDIQDGTITNTFIGRLELPEDGLYAIEVRSWENTNGGGYQLEITSSLEALPTLTPTPKG